MPDNEGFVHDFLLPDSNTRRFHAGDACQWSPPVPEGEVEPQVAGMIAAHREAIHAPGSRVRGRFGLDEDGAPIETSYLGVGVDPESGALVPLDKDGNPREEFLTDGESRSGGRRRTGRGSRAEDPEKPDPRRPEPRPEPKPEPAPTPTSRSGSSPTAHPR